jgi:peptidase M16 domain-containing protein
MKYNRTELAENIGFSSIIDEKFKTARLSVRFITNLDKASAAANSLGIGVLSSSNGKYKTFAEMNEKLSLLYGASLGTSSKKRGDIQILTLSASWINNRFAIDGEDIDGEMLRIVRDCIFAPNAENGEFDADSFRITRKDILDRIDAEINNKRGYALSRASEIAFKGEPAELSCYGDRKSAESVTSSEAFAAYKKFLETAQVEICYISPEENPEAAELFKKSFAAVNRDSKAVKFRNISPVRSEVAEGSDEFDVRQCKMVLTFKSDSDDAFAMKLVSAIFGETPVSKLFVNVREKLSLCYYCACRLISSKGALMVDSGVERENIDKAKDEIIRQLDEIKNGNISDEEIQSAMLALENGLEQIGDTPSSYESWYFERFCDGEAVTPAERLNDYKNVTKERIVQAANSLKLDSIYLMLDKGEA